MFVMGKSLFAVLGAILGVSLLDPSLSWAGSPAEKSDKIQVVFAQDLRLTDIVLFKKPLRIVWSDPHDFRIVHFQKRSRLHLVVEPLNATARTDVFIYGAHRNHCLRVKTVPKGQHYETRVEVREHRSVPRP